MPEQTKEQKINDQPLGVPPSEFHPHRPAAPLRKRGKVKTAIIVAILIILLDLFIYFFLIKPDDSELLKAIEPLKPPAATATPSASLPVETEIIVPSQDVKKVTALAKEDLAKRLNIPASEISVVSEETVTWNDGSLGCPQPDMMYTQALVEGSKVVLSAKKNNYDYHAGTDDKPFICENSAR